MNPPDRKLLAKEWIDVAQDDLSYACTGYEETVFYPQICFQCQQSSEKALKGLLVFSGIEPPRTHDLSYLLDRCIIHASGMETHRHDCELLSEFYIETRYPPDIPEYQKEDAQNAIESASRILDTVKQITGIG